MQAIPDRITFWAFFWSEKETSTKPSWRSLKPGRYWEPSLRTDRSRRRRSRLRPSCRKKMSPVKPSRPRFLRLTCHWGYRKFRASCFAFHNGLQKNMGAMHGIAPTFLLLGMSALLVGDSFFEFFAG